MAATYLDRFSSWYVYLWVTEQGGIGRFLEHTWP